MTYIDYLNDFNQWLETNALPASSQLMFYKLLYVFNRAGWPEYVGVDNLRLMIMTDTKTENTVIRARDRLVESGFITYKKGKKGSPNLYSLSRKHCNNYSIYDSVSDSISDSVSDSISDSHIKNKKKTKIKNILPPTPKSDDLGFGEKLSKAFSDWIQYKQEKQQRYKPTGLANLISQVKKQSQIYGEDAVADLISECMASNWQGIIWDKLEKNAINKSRINGAGATRPQPGRYTAEEYKKIEEREREIMKKYLEESKKDG